MINVTAALSLLVIFLAISWMFLDKNRGRKVHSSNVRHYFTNAAIIISAVYGIIYAVFGMGLKAFFNIDVSIFQDNTAILTSLIVSNFVILMKQFEKIKK